MSQNKPKKRGRISKPHRYTSNVFSMFTQAQIQEFKEAFNLIDQNRDGYIDKEDLIEILTSLGKNPTDNHLEMMLQQAPGPLNFTMFLTMFGEKLNGTDPDEVIYNAFACFDEKQSGVITEKRLRLAMTTMGDRWTNEMVDELYHCAPTKSGNVLYPQLIKTIKHGANEDGSNDVFDISPQKV